MSTTTSFTLYLLGSEVTFFPRNFKKNSVDCLMGSLTVSFPMYVFKLRYKEFRISPYSIDKKGLFPIYYVKYVDKATLKNYLIGYQGEDEDDATLYLHKDFAECLDMLYLYALIFDVIKEWVEYGRREF